MSTDLAPRRPAATDFDAIERVIATGDLAKLTSQERVSFYRQTCESLGLNPLTQPFQYITLSGKLTLYARKDCTDQLRKLNGVSIVNLDAKQVGDIYVVRAQARDTSGREDCATGAVAIAGLRGESLANALMKAETKAKRRVTLSICGLGMLDETEVETIPAEDRAPAPPQPPPRPALTPPTPAPAVNTVHNGDNWNSYILRVSRTANDAWDVDCKLGGIHDRHGWDKMIPSMDAAVNHLVTAAVDADLLDLADVNQAAQPDKRDRLMARSACLWLWDKHHEWVTTEVENWITERRERARQAVGLVGADDDEPRPIREREPGEEG